MSTPANFVHLVYFYLAEDAAPDAAQKLAEACKTYLPGIPSVVDIHVGFPAGTPRPVVDNSYGVALMVTFADKAGHDIYQDHPDHHKFIDAAKQYWSRVQIYDSISAL